MAAYASHLRKIHASEAYYGGTKPTPKPFTTDRDILDANHKFLREGTDSADPLTKEYYESLIKDCVLVDLSRYKEKQVAMRWRTLEEVKAGKGDTVCANVECGHTEGLAAMEVVFGYVEDGKKRDVLVKCVLCERCGRKMRKAKGGVAERKRRRSREEGDDDRERRSSRHREVRERSHGKEEETSSWRSGESRKRSHSEEDGTERHRRHKSRERHHRHRSRDDDPRGAKSGDRHHRAEKQVSETHHS